MSETCRIWYSCVNCGHRFCIDFRKGVVKDPKVECPHCQCYTARPSR